MRPLLSIVIIMLSSTTSHFSAAELPAPESLTIELLNAQTTSPDGDDGDIVLGYLTEIVRLGGGGFRDTERSAFLVRDDDGSVDCLLWPKQMAFRKQQFHGTIPSGTIAIVHTHPRSEPRPSSGDRREAMRLGITFVVLTPRNIFEVSPSGDVIEVVRNRSWRLPAGQQSLRCEPFSGDDEPKIVSSNRLL